MKEMCQKFGQFQAGDISTAIDQLDICFKLWLSVSLEHFDIGFNSFSGMMRYFQMIK